eukprot:220788_1
MSIDSSMCSKYCTWIYLEVISCHVATVALLYSFQDSLLNTYINEDKLYFNILFHFIQTVSLVSYFIISFKDPGQITLQNYNNQDEEGTHFNVFFDIEQDDNDLLIGPNQVKPPTPQTNINNTNSQFPSKYIEVFIDNENSYEFMVTDTIPEYNRKIIIDENAPYPCNYCEPCHFIRPIRSKHCNYCGICVTKFDHHCPLVNNCVGAYNYKYFVTFLLCTFMFVSWSLYMSINTLFGIVVDNGTLNDTKVYYQHTILGWIFRIIFFIVAFILFFEIGGLLGIHLYLICTGQTTLEYMRPDFNDKYLYEEVKRKMLFQNKQLNNQQVYNPQMDHNQDDITIRSVFQYKFYGDINSYTKHFNYGLIKNILNVFSCDIPTEWKTAIKCKVREVRAPNMNGQDNISQHEDEQNDL